MHHVTSSVSAILGKSVISMARQPRNRNRVRDLREVIEARRAARNRASILARQETIARAQSVGRAMIAANDWNIVEVITPRTDIREFVMPFQVPVSDIIREGLDTVLRRVLRDFP